MVISLSGFLSGWVLTGSSLLSGFSCSGFFCFNSFSFFILCSSIIVISQWLLCSIQLTQKSIGFVKSNKNFKFESVSLLSGYGVFLHLKASKLGIVLKVIKLFDISDLVLTEAE